MMVVAFDADVAVGAVEGPAGYLEAALSAEPEWWDRYMVRTTPVLCYCLMGLAMPGSLKATRR